MGYKKKMISGIYQIASKMQLYPVCDCIFKSNLNFFPGNVNIFKCWNRNEINNFYVSKLMRLMNNFCIFY